MCIFAAHYQLIDSKTMRKRVLFFLFITLTAVGLAAGQENPTLPAVQEAAELRVLNVETTDGQTYHFLLSDHQPVLTSQNGQMRVTWLAKAEDSERSVLTFQHQDVARLTFSDYDPTPVRDVPQQRFSDVFFDLTSPNRVIVRGLKDGERVTVHHLDGRSVLPAVRSLRGQAIVDLSRQPSGTFLINAGGLRTFKLLKP